MVSVVGAKTGWSLLYWRFERPPRTGHLLLGCAGGAVLFVKALSVLEFEDLLAPNPQGLRVSPRFLAEVGLGTWMNQGVSHFARCALTGNASPNFMKIHVTEESERGE